MPVSVSVIIPVYNPGERLVPCLESVLAQTVRDWELLLVDDGSTDGSGVVCDTYAARDSRIRVLHLPNGGPGAARNRGMQEARGAWIAFIDADDTVSQDYLSLLLGADSREGDLVITGMLDEFADGRPARSRYAFPEDLAAKDISALPESCPILELGYPVAKLFDAALIRTAGLRMDSTLRLHEDHLFVLQYIMAARRIVLTKGTPYHYWHDTARPGLTQREKPVAETLREAATLTEAMLAVRERYPSYPLPAFRRAISLYGLNDYVKALRSARDKAEYREVAAAIKARRKVFFAYFRPPRGFLHKWWNIIPIFVG